MVPRCKNRYLVHIVAVDLKCRKTIWDQAFSVPKCVRLVRLARMSRKPYELLCKMFAAVLQKTKIDLEPILGKKFMGCARGKFSNSEREKQNGSTTTEYNAVDGSD